MQPASRIPAWYRQLVRLYPNPFRAEFGDDLALVFEETWRNHSSRSVNDRLRFLTFVAWDFLKSMAKEWTGVLRWPDKVVLGGAAYLVLTDLTSHTCSGIANAAYLWGGIAIAVVAIRPVAKRRWSLLPLSIASVLGPSLYFGAICLQTTSARHASLGRGYDLACLALLLFTVGSDVASASQMSNPARKNHGWFGQHPFSTGLKILCVACAAAGVIRFGVWGHDDDTVFLLIGNSLFTRLQGRWNQPTVSPPPQNLTRY
jgi:hypothetical protein